MKIFEVDFTWSGAIQIEAENEAEALEKFADMSYSEIAEVAHSTFEEEILDVLLDKSTKECYNKYRK